MAYTPINWQTGDTITAEKLNKCDNGWSVESSSSTYYSGSITTESWGNYCGGSADGLAEGISADTAVTVSFNGTDYALTIDSDGQCGAPYNDGSDTYDFTTYPFGLYIYYGAVVSSYVIELYTESAGTYSLTIAIGSTTVEISDNFQSAVNTATHDSAPLIVVAGTTTWQEVHDAVVNGRSVYYFEDTGTPTIIRDVAVRVSEFAVAFITVFGSSFTLTTLSASSADGVLTAS